MNRETTLENLHTIQYGSKTIEFSLRQSARKTLRIEVHPDTKVSVKAPYNVSYTRIADKIRQKASWIRKQIEFFEGFYPKYLPKQYISGESFFYLGDQYILDIYTTTTKEGVALEENHMIVHKHKDSSTQEILEARYKDQAYKVFDNYLYPILDSFKQHDIVPQDIRVRTMTTRRGTCNQSGVITLNTELVKAPRGCIEYVIAHECCHLVEFNHTKRFYTLLESVMPDWKMRKDKLEKLLA